jgi:alpha-mannosidase
MCLSLLRAPTVPDPIADRGRHEFVYSLLPHASDFRTAGVIEEAYALNVPLIVREVKPAAGPLPATHSFFRLEGGLAVIEAIKRAEDSDAVIVRFYEAAGSRGPVTVTTSLPMQKAWLADLLENEIEKLPIKKGRVKFDLKPFEIVTLKLAR